MEEIGGYKLGAVTIEIRYDLNVRFWDRSGAVWSAIADALGKPRYSADVAPNKVQAEVGGKYTVCTELDKAYVLDHDPKDLDKTSASADAFVDCVFRVLELETVSRLAARVIYRKLALAPEDANADLRAMPAFAIANAHPVLEAPLASGHTVLQWNSGGRTAVLRLLREAVSWQVEPTIVQGQLGVTKNAWSRHATVADLDYFHEGRLKRGMVSARDWLSETTELARRVLPPYLDGDES